VLAKKKQVKPKREMTKHQLSGWQKQQKRQRLIFNIAVFVVAAVFLVIGFGWYFTEYRPRQETVLIVNGTEFKMDYYITALKYYGRDNPDSLGLIGQQVLSIIQESELLKQGAEELVIGVSDEVVAAEIENYDLSQEYRELFRAELLSQKVFEHFKSQSPVYAEHRHVLAMFLESESKASEVRDGIEAGDDFGELAELVSVDSYTRGEKGDLGFQVKEVLALPAFLGSDVAGDYAFSAEVGTLSQPVPDEGKVKVLGYWLLKVVEKEDDSGRVKIHGILLGSRDEAEVVNARLESGEDFAALAEEFSQHKDSREQGGDLLDWFGEDTIIPAFKTFALNPEVVLGEVSDIIRDETAVTIGGCWLLKVLEKDDNREVSDDDRTILAGTAYDDWFSSLRTRPENQIEILIDQEQRSWAVEVAGRELS
jgi:parvulin-like peptidyl-prolyl isomerase